MAAKKGPAYSMSAEHRDKIRNSNILNALIEHVVAGREMSATQVSAGLGLLKKVMPDLQAIGGDDEMAPVGMTFGWLTEARSTSQSHTSHENTSDPSMIASNAGPPSSPIAEPARPSPASTT